MLSSEQAWSKNDDRAAGSNFKAASKSSLTLSRSPNGISMSGFQFMVKPGFGEIPFLFDGCGSNTQELGCFVDRHPSEKAQLDNAALQRIRFFQPRQGFIHCQDFFRLALFKEDCFLKQNPFLVTSTFFSAVGARIFNENTPHDLCRHAEEGGTVFQINPALFHQPEIKLVDQSGRLKNVVRPFMAHLGSSNAAQILIYQTDQLFQGALIASCNPVQEVGYLSRLGFHPKAILLTTDSDDNKGLSPI